MTEPYSDFSEQEQQSFIPQGQYNQMQSNSAGFSPMPPDSNVPQSTKILSQDEFNNLIKTVQLLRISQLRYIVQKYSIPASGNKTKLLGLVIQVFHNLRMDPVLVEILQDISNLLAQQDAPFATPAISSGSLEPCEPNSDFSPPFNPTIALDPETPVFGPLIAKPGRSTGKFTFASPPTSNTASTLLTFMFYNGNPQPVSILFELNGIPFEISKDDPLTSPIDISNVISQPGVENIFEVKSLNTAVPTMIQFFQYEYIGLRACVNQICSNVDITQETPMVRTNNCEHQKPFSFVQFISNALATGKWTCPICGADAQLQNLTFVESVANNPPQKTNVISKEQDAIQQKQVQFAQLPVIDSIQPDSIFAPQPTDIFANTAVMDHFEWDAF